MRRDSAEAAISAHLVLWMDSIHTDMHGRQWNKLESRGDRTFVFRCTDRAWHWAADSGAIVGGVLDSSRIVGDTGAGP